MALPPEFVRRGFTAEAARHRTEMRHALARARQLLGAAEVADGRGEADPHALRQLVIEAADAAERGFALQAVLEVAEFARPEED
jgi:hypothetical protein